MNWLPIETAPVGKTVLVAQGFEVLTADWDGVYWTDAQDYEGLRTLKPDWWMPLPIAPRADR